MASRYAALAARTVVRSGFEAQASHRDRKLRGERTCRTSKKSQHAARSNCSVAAESAAAPGSVDPATARRSRPILIHNRGQSFGRSSQAATRAAELGSEARDHAHPETAARAADIEVARYSAPVVHDFELITIAADSLAGSHACRRLTRTTVELPTAALPRDAEFCSRRERLHQGCPQAIRSY